MYEYNYLGTQRLFSINSVDNDDQEKDPPTCGKLTLSIRTKGKYRDRRNRVRYRKKSWTLDLSKGSVSGIAAIKRLEKEFQKPTFKKSGRLTPRKLESILNAFRY